MKASVQLITMLKKKKERKNSTLGPGTVVHDCNPSYSEGIDQDDHWLSKNKEDSISPNMLSTLVHTCNPTLLGDIDRRSTAKASLGKITRVLL
jgi:hypothetical protein